jgi:hypothetical protein
MRLTEIFRGMPALFYVPAAMISAASSSYFVPTQQENMNGEPVLATTPGGTPGLFPKQYKDYPRGVESYDVYSPPMTTYYSQVWWKPLAPVPLPEEMVKKYAGKDLAIVGWEIDQVIRNPEGADTSVPINACYNHHYNSNLIGSAARFKKIWLDGPDDPHAADLLKVSHGVLNYDQPHYVVEHVNESIPSAVSSTFLSSANGGEYRYLHHCCTRHSHHRSL